LKTSVHNWYQHKLYSNTVWSSKRVWC